MNENPIRYKSKFVPPYDQDGKASFSYNVFSQMAGVYIIKRDKDVLYVGYSKRNLYKTLYRHFERWTHPIQMVTTYYNNMTGIKVRIFVTTHATAEYWESYFIKKLKPKDNINLSTYEMTPEEKQYFAECNSKTPEEMPF